MEHQQLHGIIHKIKGGNNIRTKKNPNIGFFFWWGQGSIPAQVKMQKNFIFVLTNKKQNSIIVLCK